MAKHDFVVKGKLASGSGLDVQRCRRCGLEIWPDGMKKAVGGARWERVCVPPQGADAIPCDPTWQPSGKEGWTRLSPQ